MSDAPTKLAQARALFTQGKLEQARSVLARALARDAADPDLNADMARVLALSGQFAQSVFYAERAARARPDDAPTLAVLGGALMAARRPAEADAALARALAIDPSMRDALATRVDAMLALSRGREAAELAREGLARHTSDAGLQRSLAYALLTSARCEEAVAVLRDAAAAHPSDPLLAGALASTLNYYPGIPAADVLTAHVAHAQLLRAAAGRSKLGPPPTPSDPDRPLRIGIVSPDLCLHPVAFFLEPILAHLDRTEFNVTCYATGGQPDPVTARLRSLVESWRDVGPLRDPEIAAKLRTDRIDIAIDLAGLTTGGRPGVFVHRPAPVQAAYLGYPATTGLTEINARIVDSRTDPVTPGSPPHTTEDLVRLDPCFLCYRPPLGSDAPEPARGHSDSGIVFGSFNAIQKLNQHVIDLWSRLLRSVPGSRLVLKTAQLSDAALQRDLLDRFAAAGADPGRIELLARTPDLRSHLGLYSTIDIALDPFPYNGTTTTCDSLFMGVPVVTLAGAMHAGRVGVSLLSAVGLEDLIARDEDDYVRLAGALAADLARRAELRAGLRLRLLSSPLCDKPGHAARFGAALRNLWRLACERRT